MLTGALIALGLLVLLVGGSALATLVITLVLDRRYPPAGRFADLPGGRIAAIEAGPGQGGSAGPGRGTIVLLHGASANAADPMFGIGRRLADHGYRVVALDRPGFGWSDRSAGDPGARRDAASPAVQADAIALALERLGVPRAIVLGHSWSGALATNLALDHPERVSGLVLISPATHPWPGDPVQWYYRTAAVRGLGWLMTRTIVAPLGLSMLPRAVPAIFAPQAAPPGYLEASRILLVLRPSTFWANAEDLVGLHDFVARQSPRYGAIDVPTLVFAGDADRIVPTDLHARALVRQVPDAHLVVLPGVGHMPHYADPERLVTEIDALAARVAAREGARDAARAAEGEGR